MVTGAQRASQEGQLPELPAGKPPAQSAQRVSSVPTALSAVPPGTADAHAQSPDSAAQVRAWLAARWSVLSAGEHPLRIDPPSAAALWAEHRKAAERWDAPIVRMPRLAYGLVHTGVALSAYWLLWAMFSPIGLILCCALGWALVTWS